MKKENCDRTLNPGFTMSGKFLLCLLLLGALQITASPSRDSFERFEFQQLKMGTLFRLIVYAPESSVARKVAGLAFRRVEQLESRLSDYRADSELSQLVASGGPQVVSRDLFHVVEESIRFSRLSGGAFDISVAPLVRLWNRAGELFQLPTAPEIDAVRARVGYRRIVLNSMLRSVRLEEGMKLDLGGIGKGFAADEALAELKAGGLSRVLVDAGGDIRVGDSPPDQTGWRIEIEGDAAFRFRLANAGVASSGDRYRYQEIDGTRYSHIIDPRSGQALTQTRLVTAVASDAITADALATILSVVDIAEGRRIVEELPGVAARISRQGTAPVVLVSGSTPNPFR